MIEQVRLTFASVVNDYVSYINSLLATSVRAYVDVSLQDGATRMMSRCNKGDSDLFVILDASFTLKLHPIVYPVRRQLVFLIWPYGSASFPSVIS